MAVFWAMARLRFLTMLAYRLNYWSGVLTYTVYIGGYYYIWRAVYAGRPSVAGMSIGGMVTYLAVAWMTRAFTYNNLDGDIEEEVRSGLVAIQLLRPYPYVVGKLWSAGGEAVFRLAFWMLPGMLVAALLFPVHLPTHPLTYAVWVASAACAFLVNAQLNTAFGLFAFSLQNARGIRWAKTRLVDLLSGVYLPLGFFPAAAQRVMSWLPFRDIAYVPAAIFTGTIPPAQAAAAVAGQLAWVGGMAVVVAVFWRRLRRVLLVQGG